MLQTTLQQFIGNPAGLATGAILSLNLEFDGLRPTLLAASLPPIGVAYYRQWVIGEGAPGAEGTGVQSREEVRRGVHSFATSTVAVSVLQSLSDHLVVSATPKVVWVLVLGRGLTQITRTGC